MKPKGDTVSHQCQKQVSQKHLRQNKTSATSSERAPKEVLFLMLPSICSALSCQQQVCQRISLFRRQPLLTPWDFTDKPRDITGPGIWCAESPSRSGSHTLNNTVCVSTSKISSTRPTTHFINVNTGAVWRNLKEKARVLNVVTQFSVIRISHALTERQDLTSQWTSIIVTVLLLVTQLSN